MATLKQRLHKKNSSGSYDTLHLETSASLVLMSNGTTVENAINGKAASNHTHSGYAASNHTHPEINASVGVVKTYPSITIPAASGYGWCEGKYVIDLSSIGFTIYKALVTITDRSSTFTAKAFATKTATAPSFGIEKELVTETTINTSYETPDEINSHGFMTYRSIRLSANKLTLITFYGITSKPSEHGLLCSITPHTWTNLTFKLFA